MDVRTHFETLSRAHGWKHAYRQLSKQYHPDKLGSTDAMTELNLLVERCREADALQRQVQEYAGYVEDAHAAREDMQRLHEAEDRRVIARVLDDVIAEVERRVHRAEAARRRRLARRAEGAVAKKKKQKTTTEDAAAGNDEVEAAVPEEATAGNDEVEAAVPEQAAAVTEEAAAADEAVVAADEAVVVAADEAVVAADEAAVVNERDEAAVAADDEAVAVVFDEAAVAADDEVVAVAADDEVVAVEADEAAVAVEALAADEEDEEVFVAVPRPSAPEPQAAEAEMMGNDEAAPMPRDGRHARRSRNQRRAKHRRIMQELDAVLDIAQAARVYPARSAGRYLAIIRRIFRGQHPLVPFEYHGTVLDSVRAMLRVAEETKRRDHAQTYSALLGLVRHEPLLRRRLKAR
jgi:hypothetical protein